MRRRVQTAIFDSAGSIVASATVYVMKAGARVTSTGGGTITALSTGTITVAHPGGLKDGDAVVYLSTSDIITPSTGVLTLSGDPSYQSGTGDWDITLANSSGSDIVVANSGYIAQDYTDSNNLITLYADDFSSNTLSNPTSTDSAGRLVFYTDQPDVDIYVDGTNVTDRYFMDIPTESRLIIDVREFGATGDGSTDDTDSIQAACNWAMANGGGVVWFPTGTYIVTQIDVQAGMTLEGDGGAVLKKKASQPTSTRTFTTQNYLHSAATDSAPLVFRNLRFDGNRANQGTYTGYEKDQMHSIFLMGNSNNTGRLRAIVDGCTFVDGTADGVSVYTNVDFTVSNCFFEDMFRGAVNVTGGWTKGRIVNCSAVGDTHPSGFDFEIDGAGYGGSVTGDFEMSNIEVQGNFDIGIKSGGSFHGSNINVTSQPTTFSGIGKYRFSNCTFTTGIKESSANRLISPNDMQFNNCTWVGEEQTDSGVNEIPCVDIFWNVATSYTGQRCVFEGCTFRLASNVEAADTTYGIYTRAADQGDDNILFVNNCRFENGLDYGVYLLQGGKLRVKDSWFDCTTAVRAASAGVYDVDYLADGVQVTDNVTTYLYLYGSGGGGSGQVVEHRNCYLTESQNTLGSFTTWGGTIRGNRTILATNTPSASSNKGGFLGDRWVLATPVAGSTAEWICTASHVSAATWKPIGTPDRNEHIVWSIGDVGNLGVHYAAGFYIHAATDNNFSPGPVTLGSANLSYAAHVYFVAASGATDTQITVTGTSITDAGTRTTSDTEVVSLTDGAANSYYETSKKFIGQVSISKTAGTDRLCNYGFAKYWDNFNSDFTVKELEATWLGAAADSGLDIELLHHKSTGWTYNAGAPVTTPTALASLQTAHNTEYQMGNNVPGAFKYTGIDTAIDGDGSEGIMFRITTGTNNSLAYMNLELGFTEA